MTPPHSLILAPKSEERKGHTQALGADRSVPMLLSHKTELCDPNRWHYLSVSPAVQ